jgi:hypothetical protein
MVGKSLVAAPLWAVKNQVRLNVFMTHIWDNQNSQILHQQGFWVVNQTNHSDDIRMGNILSGIKSLRFSPFLKVTVVCPRPLDLSQRLPQESDISYN